MRSPRLRGTSATPPPSPPPNPQPSAPPRPLLLRRYGSLLPKGPDRVVVLLSDDPDDDRVGGYRQAFAHDRVHVLSMSAAPLHAQMQLIGRTDLLIVLTAANGEAHAELWEQLFFFVKSGGAYVVERESITGSSGSAGLLARLAETVALQDEQTANPDELVDVTPLKTEIAHTSARVVLDRAFFIVGKRRDHHLKILESEANELLPARGDETQLRVLASLPAGEFHSTATVTSHESSEPIHNLETTIRYPQMHLREYTGRVGLVAQSLLITDDAALPDSFRWHQAPDPRNPAAVNADKHFLRVKPMGLPEETLPGSYYLLDNSFYGHFGHLMTEVVSKLWGWDRAKAEFPDLKAIYRTQYDWELERLAGIRLFQAYGIAEADIIRVDRPVWVERMVGATPMWHNALPHYVHPDMAAVWDRLSAGIGPVRYDGARKIFVSRQPDLVKRPCRNAGQVEALFAAHGYDVVYPELLDLPEQVGLFRDAEIVAGFGGSALFNIMYCHNLQTLIVLNHESYTARNEHLYAMVKGCDVHYFWSDPDLRHPDGGWTEAAFASSWEFDFDRNREPLIDVLNALT